MEAHALPSVIRKYTGSVPIPCTMRMESIHPTMCLGTFCNKRPYLELGIGPFLQSRCMETTILDFQLELTTGQVNQRTWSDL